MDPFLYGAYLGFAPQTTKRKGKWGTDEENYTNKIIEAFNAGTLTVPPNKDGGQLTLRAYLAEKLNCDPMRITKKFTGASCLGKRVYHKVSHHNGCTHTKEELEAVSIELAELETKFKSQLEESARKKREELNGVNVDPDLYQFREGGISREGSLESAAPSSSSKSNVWSSNMTEGLPVTMEVHIEACKEAKKAYLDHIRTNFSRVRDYQENSTAQGGGSSSGSDSGGDSSSSSIRVIMPKSLAWDNDEMHKLGEASLKQEQSSLDGKLPKFHMHSGADQTSSGGSTLDSNSGSGSDSAGCDDTDSNEGSTDHSSSQNMKKRAKKGHSKSSPVLEDSAAASALLGLGGDVP